MKTLFLLLLLCSVTQVNSAELFGVNLTAATRDELRIAVKKAGVKLVQEAGNDAFYDIYKGDAVLHKASKLYLGFVKKDKKFAFAEYEFNGLKQPVMLNKLKQKYGSTKPLKGKFSTDKSYSWSSNGTQITFYQDWRAYKTRLIYYNPEALKSLRNEQKVFEQKLNQSKQIYLDKGY